MSGLFGPKPINPTKVANAQVGANKQILEQHYGFMPNQMGIGIGQTWGTDASGRPNVQTSLSPENQALYGGELANRGILGQGLSGLIGNYANEMMTPFNATQAGMDATLGGAGIANIVGEQFWGPQRNWLDSQLRNQGLAPTDAQGRRNIAYDQSFRQLGQNQFNQYLGSVMPWQQAMANQAQQSRSMNFSNIGQLLGSSVPSLPVQLGNYTTPGQTTPDMTSLFKTQHEQEQARANAIGNFIGQVASFGMGLPFGAGTIGSAIGGSLGNGLGNMLGLTPFAATAGKVGVG